ncbi:hypothetical protein MBLNU230_g6643t1 [Neophaeotheca triangularis]
MSKPTFSAPFEVLDFYCDSDDSCALTALINNVRFHVIAESSKVRSGKPGQEYSKLLQAVKKASQDDMEEGTATADSADSGVELGNEEAAHSEATKDRQEVTPNAEEKLHRWLLSPLDSDIEELAPQLQAEDKPTLQDWFTGETHYFDLASSDGGVVATELEEVDELSKRLSRLLPAITVPKYVREVQTPYFAASDLTVLSAGAAMGPYTRPTLVRDPNGNKRFLKLIDPTQPAPTKREISLLAKLKSKNLHTKIRCPELTGLVGTTPNTRTQIAGFLQTPIPDPTPLTAKLDTDVPQTLRDAWADEAERIVTTLHDHGIVWGDAKADNFIVDDHDRLWIIDFGGSYTEGWVDPAIKETEEGDEMGVEKIENALHDPEHNTWDPDTEVSYGGSHRNSESESQAVEVANSRGKRGHEDVDSDAETDVGEGTNEVSTGNKRRRTSSPPASPLASEVAVNWEKEQPLYCYCHKPSSGRMVGCDGDDCKQEWFHFECVGLNQAPAEGEEWYCKDCV